MAKKIISCIMAAFLLIGVIYTDISEGKEFNGNELYALSAVLMDGDSGRVLFGKNCDEQRPMASTTKIMSLIIALEYGNVDDIVTVSDYAAKMPDVQLNIRAGEQYVLKDLMYSMIMESHNDSAVAVAEHIGGDVKGFAGLMNQKAGEIGLKATYFITPNGLDACDDKGVHSTTARELALIMKYCIMDSPKHEEFISMCQTRDYSFTDYEGKRSFNIRNKNALFDIMDGVIAGKTGFTADAGYCYICGVKREDKTYIVALLGCGWPNNKSYKWSDTKKLISYGEENYTYRRIIDGEYEIPYIEVKNGIESENICLCIKDECDLVLCDDDKITFKSNLPPYINAPVKEGDIVGSLDIYINEQYFTSLNIYAESTVNRISFRYCLKSTVFSFFP